MTELHAILCGLNMAATFVLVCASVAAGASADWQQASILCWGSLGTIALAQLFGRTARELDRRRS